MRPRLLPIALFAALGSGCSSLDKSHAALHIEPVFSIQHSARDTQSYYQLGRYFQGQSRLKQAEEAYLKAVAIDDHNVNALNALGSLYAERGELERSAEMFRKVTAMAPNVAYLFNNLGFAYFLQGRMDEAYAAVLKALTLDEKLERGWINLERIAARHSDAAFIEAVKSRRLDALPTDFAMAPPAGHPAPDSVQIASAQSIPPQPGQPGQLLGGPSLEVVADTVSPSVSISPPNDMLPMAHDEKQILGGKFVLVSADREVVSQGGAIEITTANSQFLRRAVEAQVPIMAPRIEVSNGNGVTGFAKRVSSQLRNNKLLVTRITNHTSFLLSRTEVQYDPRYEDAARKLVSKFNLTGRLIPAGNALVGVDIRIVLGRDAVQSTWLANVADDSPNI